MTAAQTPGPRALTENEREILAAFPAPGCGLVFTSTATDRPPFYIVGAYDRQTGAESWEVRGRYTDALFSVHRTAEDARRAAIAKAEGRP